jgi:hypothetical protein
MHHQEHGQERQTSSGQVLLPGASRARFGAQVPVNGADMDRNSKYCKVLPELLQNGRFVEDEFQYLWWACTA